jgi:hypothetical protein
VLVNTAGVVFIDLAELEVCFDAEVVTDGGYTPRYNIESSDDDEFSSG